MPSGRAVISNISAVRSAARNRQEAMKEDGVATLERLTRELYRPPEELLALDTRSLRALLDATERLGQRPKNRW